MREGEEPRKVPSKKRARPQEKKKKISIELLKTAELQMKGGEKDRLSRQDPAVPPKEKRRGPRTQWT